MTCLMSCSMSLVIVFFFKQKTAYEMRISDWSSDVCSSDLPSRRHQRHMRKGLVKSGLAAALDIGSSKVCCIIARADGAAMPRVVGIGQQASREIGRASCRESVCQYV